MWKRMLLGGLGFEKMGDASWKYELWYKETLI